MTLFTPLIYMGVVLYSVEMLVNTVICVLGIGNRRCTENSMNGSTGEKRSVGVQRRKGAIKKTRTPNERLEL